MRLKTNVVFADAPQPYGSLWLNLSHLENQLAQKLLAHPGSMAVIGVNAWYLVEAGGELQLCHGNLIDGRLVDESSRFDFDLGFGDVEEDALNDYVELLQRAIEDFDGLLRPVPVQSQPRPAG